MTNRNDEIKQANRKALPKFILILVVAALIGGMVGASGALLGIENLADGLYVAGFVFASRVAPWLMVVCIVLNLIICLPMYFSAKGMVNQWDGEDEAVSADIEKKISIALWINSTILVVGLFLAGAAYSVGLSGGDLVLFPLTIVAFLVLLWESVFVQQKLVDLTKRLYPEKTASVYDVRFRKKWLDSCDEAEKIIIGKCAYKAYSAATYTCLVLWMVFTLSALFLDTGFLPVLAVCIVWGVMQSVYYYWSIKLSLPGASVLWVRHRNDR
jgi:hypothetical protein